MASTYCNKVEDGEKKLLCPFNNAHLILRSRMATHLTQCAKNYPSSPLKLCPFNGIHYIHQKEFDAHVQSCPDRFYCERFVHPTGPSAPDVSKHILAEATKTSEEDWDEVEVPSYLEKREAIISEKPLFLAGRTNEGKAARKAYIGEQTERMKRLTEAAATSEPLASGAVRKGGRGRGVYLRDQ